LTGSVPTKVVAKKPAVAVTYEVGEKIQALWTDGKWYAGQIKKIEKDKYSVLYIQYGNTAVLPIASIKKAPVVADTKDTKAAAAAKPAKK